MTSADEYYAYVRSPSPWVPIPQRLQRLLIHDYAAKSGLRVTFYVAEIPDAGIFYNLEHLVLSQPPLRGFVFYSLEHALPLAASTPFLEKVLDAGYELRFALEELVVSSKQDLQPLWTIDAVKRISDANAAQMRELVAFAAPLLT